MNIHFATYLQKGKIIEKEFNRPPVISRSGSGEN